jgi:signal transduction histidine kinase/ActR/RegA family two-component response regulator
MKTRPAILFITLISLVLIVVFFVVFKTATESKNKVLLQNRYAELRKSSKSLIEGNSKYLENFVLDNTYESELISAVSQKDFKWLNYNFVPTLNSYDIDYFWIFDNKGQLLFGKDAAGNTIPFFEINKTLFCKTLEKKPFRNFYVKFDTAITQIVIAPIDLTGVIKNHTAQYVYFVCGKKYDKSYLDKLSSISTGAGFYIAHKIQVPEDSVNSKKNIINYQYALIDFSGNTLATLISSKTFDEINVYSNYLSNYSMLYLIFILLLLFAYYQYLGKKVLRPIALLSQALDKKDSTYLGNLKLRGDEFADMANLIDDSFKSNKKLNEEIQLRVRSENELKVAAVNLENATIEKIRAEQDRLAKGDFLSTMSHEIRTPINGIIGIANLLKTEKLKRSQHDLVDTLLFSSNYLLSILTDILDFSKIESGNLTFDNIQFNLREICESVQSLNNANAQKKGIGLVLNADKNVADYISGDSVRLCQMLNNLVGNAIKFTDKGEVQIAYRLLHEKDNQQTIEFTVKDSGIGIAADKLDTIFESFSQADRTISTNYGGTGLGLTITKKLIELQGGSIKVDSKINKGTTFTFVLTFQKVNVWQYKEQKKIRNQCHLNLDGLKVLVAEDNKINATILNKFLDKWNVKMDHAVNGSQVLEKLKVQEYDLILMDLHMPVMGGKEATKIIREDKLSSYNQIPIIALTADATTETQKIILESGFNEYVTKPFNPDKLYSVLEKYNVSLVGGV